MLLDSSYIIQPEGSLTSLVKIDLSSTEPEYHLWLGTTGIVLERGKEVARLSARKAAADVFAFLQV